MAVTAGKRDQRISVQPWTGTQANGVTTKSWGSGADRWAEVKALSGGELDNGTRIVMDATHEFTIPRPTAVGVRDRLTWWGQFWDIVSIDQTDRQVIRIQARAGQRAGN